MFRADSFKDRGASFIGKSTRQVSTQGIHAVTSGDLIPQVFELNRPLRIALGQQRGSNFSTYYNLAMFSPYTLNCFNNEIAYHFRTANGISRVVDSQSSELYARRNTTADLRVEEGW